MSDKENKRALVLSKVDRGELTAAQAGEVTGLSVRQVRRLLAAFRQQGPKVLAHGNRGRKPAHTLDSAVRLRVIELARTKYADFNHQHFTEKLEGEQIFVSRSTVRRVLLGAGIKSPRKRRAPKHRRRRERRPQPGMMLQIDGSRHDWLEGRGPYLTLVGAIDDATGEVPYALFRDREDAQGYFLLMREIALSHGLPLSLYSDRHAIFVPQKQRPSLEEELSGEQELTQFGRLLRELEVESILALSPQAKGRVERLWGTFQDRLVSELRLAGAASLAQANEVLREFLVSYNQRFVVAAKDSTTAYRALPGRLRLEEVFCFKYGRTVAKDNTVKLEERVVQIPAGPRERSYAKARVVIHEGMDGSLGVFYRGRRIAYEEPLEEGAVLRTKSGKFTSAPRPGVIELETGLGIAKKDNVGKETKRKEAEPRAPQRPAPEHPWRKPGLAALELRRKQA